ncbi:MAG TPA: ribonuclease H [Flavobacteriaceae bacterium]|jgi:ribonuclease HI|nr:ribonuclease H [Flavobacteriaceae bacterium]MAM30715.1 ribonuclease H [Flavobacteriaceae bacterium]MAY52912.1 ribonuclease H [Flavobacteriaceae bacterium]HBR55703.1 ribonuclease H [Flavobacteriaceae bacterium]HIB47358.1 ribonuclease H [Flavobacteriaceae bacterium]|tara:strand:- start:483 stop:1121 length:639 start_codon:yes stop_codon:yes gene_type:complete
MAKKKEKFYVVWYGNPAGIFGSWKECQLSIKGVSGAQYKSFNTFAEAKTAYNKEYADYKGKNTKKKTLTKEQLAKIGEPNLYSIAVDAASSGNPGKMEYRGVDTQTHKQLFHQGPFQQGTNNVGEFLALVHGIAYLQQQKSDRIIYSDSRIAMGWVKKKKCNTKLKKSAKNAKLFELITRAEHWLKTNTYQTKVVKWETKAWGEIPADFGRK